MNFINIQIGTNNQAPSFGGGCGGPTLGDAGAMSRLAPGMPGMPGMMGPGMGMMNPGAGMMDPSMMGGPSMMGAPGAMDPTSQMM